MFSIDVTGQYLSDLRHSEVELDTQDVHKAQLPPVGYTPCSLQNKPADTQ